MQRYLKNEKVVHGENDIEIVSSVEEKIIFQKNHFISQQFKTSQFLEEKIPTAWNKKDLKPVPTYQNGKLISYYHKGIDKPFIPHITDLKDYELYQLHDSYDLENDSYVKYLAIKNLMIDRGLAHGKKYDLNNFNFDKFMMID